MVYFIDHKFHLFYLIIAEARHVMHECYKINVLNILLLMSADKKNLNTKLRTFWIYLFGEKSFGSSQRNVPKLI